MQAIKVLVVVMGVLIVAGTGLLAVMLVKRIGGAGGSAGGTVMHAVLEEPSGSHIAGVSALADRLAVQITGGGRPDRVVLIDPKSGAVAGEVALAR